MQALAVYDRPVSEVAIDYVLQPHQPAVDSAPLLKRLVNMQFVRRDAGRYSLHQVDRDYALSRAPEGEPADRDLPDPPFSRYALRDRAADYFMQTRKPRPAWKTKDDLEPQLSEFVLRCQGGQYDTAATVLNEIAYEYLQRWGHNRLTATLYEQVVRAHG